MSTGTTGFPEDILSTEEDRLYFSLDPAITIAGDVATIPTGWIELDENSEYSARGRATTADGQTRATRGHAHPVKVNAEDEITFALKPKVGVDPALDREIDRGTIMRLLRVKGDGYYRMDEVIVTEATEGSNVAGLATWTGTGGGRAHPVRGRITTWPPGGVVGP